MKNYAVGYDIGTGSIGWAVTELDEYGKPMELLDLGSRIFSTSRENGAYEKADPKAVARRLARGTRRRFDRLKQRRRAVLKQLVTHGLMPEATTEQKQLEVLDPLSLRAEAATQPLPAHHVGRALFHLQQRRGYKSNRQEGDNKEKGIIETGGAELRHILKKNNWTLGQFLYELVQNKQPARYRKKADGGYVYYPMRDIVEDEFERIWETQSAHNATLYNEEAKRAIYKAIFHQRPLKPQPRGKCLFTDEHRAPMALPVAQHFRILQKLHDIKVVGAEGGFKGRPLTAQEKQKLYTALLSKGSMSEGPVMKLLNLQDDERINLFRAGVNQKLLGDETAAEMCKESRYGKGWRNLTLKQQNDIIALLTDCEQVTQSNGADRLLESEEIVTRLIEEHHCSQEQAENMLGAKLPSAMARFSQSVFERLLPLMQPEGRNLSFSDAVRELGYHHSQSFTGEVFDTLPYYGEVLGNHCVIMPSGDENVRTYGRVSNPTVHVTLNQIRKITNALIERYGCKPHYINIELVRELKKGGKEIKEIIKNIKASEKEREEYKKKIEELGRAASDSYLAKMKLWSELAESGSPDKRLCVFTGKTISITQLLSNEIEIEHILPYSLTLDNTAANKTVTFASFNRLKGNQAPETLFASPVKWEGITITHEDVMARAQNLKASKTWRFMPGALKSFEEKAAHHISKGALGDQIMETELESFAARHLVDTSYIAKLAKKYLAYACENGEKGVMATPGTLTGMLRKAWGWNSLIPEADERDVKNRTDHRHHAVDAVVIALTNRSMVKRIADASKKAEQSGMKLTKAVAEIANPWEHYNRQRLQQMVDNIVVSHKPEHGSPFQKGQTTGQLHDDTYYGITNEAPKKKGSAVYVVRKTPEFFESIDKIEQIRDRRLRNELLRHVEGSTQKEDIKQASISFCQSRNIRGIRVLIEKPTNVMVSVTHPKTGEPYKFMQGGSNYCVDIYTLRDGKKAGIWQSEIIKTFDANQKDFTPAWQSLPNAKRIMRLHNDDMVAFEDESGKTMYYRVQKINTNGQIFFVPHHVSSPERIKEESKSLKAGSAQKRNLRKISVSPDGIVKEPYRVAKAG